MTIKIDNHTDLALARLPDQFYGAVNLRALITQIGSRTQLLETVFTDLLDKRSLSTANGKQLDGLGEILFLDRVLGETDESYRSRIISETASLEQSGEIESMIGLLKRLTSATTVFSSDVYPAALQMVAHTDTDINDPVTDSMIRLAMEVAKAGGIELILQFAPVADTFYFSSASETDVDGIGPIDPLHGFSDDAQVVGGKLSRSF